MSTIEFFYDIASPYSYLASVRIDEAAAEIGCDTRWRPYLLGGVFKGAGNVMPGANPFKAKYLLVDLHRYATRFKIPFSFSHHFPPNTVAVQRMLIAVDRDQGHDAQRRLAQAFFSAFWVSGENLTDRDEAMRVATSAGFNGAELLRAASEPEVKGALREVSDEAVARGAFGAPTFFVGERMWWGHDRIDMMCWELSS